jgi:signal transduction histidine kinase
MLDTLYVKLSAALVVLFLLIGIALVVLTRYSSELYFREVTQRLNAPIAMYVANEAPLIEGNKVNTEALQALAHHAMVINPSIEVYLLDTAGKILTHDLGKDALSRERVDLEPVRRFLQGEGNWPLHGDDPRTAADKKIFAAAEIRDRGALEGYVYVVLGGQKYEQLATSARPGQVTRLTTLAVVACVLFGLGSALLIFARLSRRLKDLTTRVNDFHRAALGAQVSRMSDTADEITQLSCAFDAMQVRIQHQVDEIRRADQIRRDLIANISHDLKTPMTTMQGYIETLTLKKDELSDRQQQEYLQIALNHAVRMNRLIADLFELARLDSQGMRAERGPFSLIELVTDIAQDFRLNAEQRSVSLAVETDAHDLSVCADIGLIARVLENLIKNGIRHTPAGGRVTIRLSGKGGTACVAVSDTGSGIAEEVLPHIFDRYYQAGQTDRKADGSSGLGLAIVKRILDLHDSAIRVDSRLGQGTTFSFELDRATSVGGLQTATVAAQGAAEVSACTH